MPVDYQKERMARLEAEAAKRSSVNRAAPPSPNAALNKVKAFVSPGSTAGILRDRQKSIAETLKKAGA